MTEILCRWLNEEVALSRHIDPFNFAKEFATGYLLGELLEKHSLQNDFAEFSQSVTADSKLNNFTRLEPTLKLLEVPFDTNIAHSIMNENHSVVTRLLYQLFITLGKKNKMGLTGVAMETMRPSGPVKLESIESGMYKERLKQLTKRQVDLNFENLVQRYQAKQKQQEELAFKAKFDEDENFRKYQQAQRIRGLERSRQVRDKHQEMMDKIREATVKIPKPPDTRKTVQSRSELRRQREAEEVKANIDAFEASLKTTVPAVSPAALDDVPRVSQELPLPAEEFIHQDRLLHEPLSVIKPSANKDYINKIRTRLEEDSVAREEREKRRRRVLVEQLKAHEAQEEAHREEMLVNRLMRQSQQERRIAVQLMQVRHEKEVIRQNRIFREQQYADRRLKDFDDALEKEAEMCRQAKLEYAEETRKANELHERLTAERKQAKYNKHYDICMQVLLEILDFSCKVGEYRELTERLVPAKLFREWRDLFVRGLPLYDQRDEELSPEEIEKEREIAAEKERLLDEGDFMEYKNLIGEWIPFEGQDIRGPPKSNTVLGHIIQRLFNIISPPEAPPPPPEFPPFPIKACFLGKFFSGKSTTIQKIAEYHRIVRLSMDQLVIEAIGAHKNGEVYEEVDGEVKILQGALSKVQSITDEPTDSPKPDDSRAVSAGSAAFSSGSTKVTPDINKLSEEQIGGIKPEDEDEKRDKTKEEIAKEKEKQGKSPATASDKKAFEVSMYKSGPKGPKPTPRAKLGSRAYAYLKKGKPTPDQLIVEIMVEAIRNVPEGTGWIMDGFPATINQAKILEKALTGYDDQKQAKDTKSAKEPGKVSRTKKSRLAPDPHPVPEQPAHKSGIDLVVLFDLPDEVALKRAEGRTVNPITEEKFHQEYNPPLEGSYTGINKQEKVVTVVDSSNDREQVQQRITGFLDSWPKLEKWFTRFGVLQKLSAEQSEDDLYEDASGILNETYQKIMAPPEEQRSEATSAQPSLPAEGEAHPSEEPSPTAEGTPAEKAALAEAQSTTPSESAISKSEKGTSKTKSGKTKTGSPKGGRKTNKKDRSPSPSASKKGVKSRSPSPPSKKGSGSRPGSKSPPQSRKGSRPGSKGSRPGSKRAKSPKKEEPEEQPTQEPEGPPEPEPGSEEWEYIDQPIEKEFAAVLARQWENTEDTYVETCKNIFRRIRHEREIIYRYFYGSRKDFVEFLKRPDEKQEYVLQWQKEFNDIAEDMRGDDDTKAEWHQRVEDLCDRLHEICDNRKEIAEKERQAIMNEGWLEDRLGILTNHYIGIMQVEVDRYQDTIRILRDYYAGMEVSDGKAPSEPVTDFVRLPLVELPPTLSPQSPSSRASDSTSNVNNEKTEAKSPSAKKDKDKGSSPKTPEPTEGVEEEQKPRIPLVPRRPKSSEGGTGKGRDKKTGQKKDKQCDPDKPETPVPPADPDERLIFDAYMLALTVIEALAAMDVADQEAEAQRQVELEKEKEKELLQKKVKENKGKKGRKSPNKSPSKTETPPPPPPEETESQSEEEKMKQMIRDKSRKEYLASVASEEKGLRTRVEMVKAHTLVVLQELKTKAESMYRDMEDWLGERFLQEVESIKAMAAAIRFAIEQEQRLQEETILEDKDFIVDLDTKTFKTPTPPPSPVQIEIPTSDSFTVTQILNLCNQFIAAAPSGVISNRGFCEVIMDMVNLTFGTESLPDIWMNITQQQLQDICSLLSPDSEFIDWRKFLLTAAQPWTPPTKVDLLTALEQFRAVDQGGLGVIDEEQYAQVDMWFSKPHSSENQPEVPELATAYDRLGKLKEAFFHIFANHNLDAPLLDYTNMLMYFSADSDPMEGFLRALSVSTGYSMPLSGSLSYIPLNESQESDIPLPMIQTPGTPPPEMDSPVSLDDLITVLHHGQSKLGDTHRLSVTSDPSDSFARERLAGLFIELGADEEEAVPFYLLYQHPIMQDCMQTCMIFKAVDLKSAFKVNGSETFE